MPKTDYFRRIKNRSRQSERERERDSSNVTMKDDYQKQAQLIKEIIFLSFSAQTLEIWALLLHATVLHQWIYKSLTKQPDQEPQTQLIPKQSVLYPPSCPNGHAKTWSEIFPTLLVAPTRHGRFLQLDQLFPQLNGPTLKTVHPLNPQKLIIEAKRKARQKVPWEDKLDILTKPSFTSFMWVQRKWVHCFFCLRNSNIRSSSLNSICCICNKNYLIFCKSLSIKSHNPVPNLLYRCHVKLPSIHFPLGHSPSWEATTPVTY